jgi:hypothetical protein
MPGEFLRYPVPIRACLPVSALRPGPALCRHPGDRAELKAWKITQHYRHRVATADIAP